MGGGLMQLVAYGAQDIYLTGNPQITFFKVVYRRHTNFAMESIEQTFNGSVEYGRRVTATISRNGDLIKDMWLECTFTENAAQAADDVSVYGLGNALVKQVEVEIGGQLIDRQYGEWMNIWTELSTPEGKRAVYDHMVGNANSTVPADGTLQVDVPLQFWFNRNPGLALPLIALQYHEVKLNLDLESATNLALAATTELSCKLWVDYVYLDTDERRRFAQVSHEYLIEQLQFTGDETVTQGSTKRVDLSFNHPVKELVWVAQNNVIKRGSATSQPCQFTNLTYTDAKLQLNGHDRFTARRAQYFTAVQPYKHHTHGPRANRPLVATSDTVSSVNSINANLSTTHTETASQFVHVYSFALNPEEHQPSGTCNFSRIDNATLVLSGVNLGVANNAADNLKNGVLKVFAVNYNVLRIMSGMGGLAYSN
jgi:hypothetical protein